ncbi:MAG TPA: 50S ribosomal protein L10 [Candidatus Thalassarchaeaceae archaeon]|jgi:large subunit ribosomal protein L10|nr:50S ribosomal protein L10 [Candidatus Thalassarchaeaceae archaeon]|tara:strand:- start:50997 stop:52016 length:1020 start_codon:yes stop_codon:yes gene_type:complete
MIPKVAGWKKDKVTELTEIFSGDGVVAVVDVSGVPASNMIDMRNTLRDRMSITMAKKSLMRIAWTAAGRSLDELENILEGASQPCVVHSESMNAFEIFGELEKTRQGRPAKAGERFPEKITIPAGPTEFGPGPIVGEFNAVGIPAKIDKGKVAIQRDTTFEQGDEISADLGIMLAKLGINPIEIGLILSGAIEEGHIFSSSELDLDTEGLRNDLILATSGSFNLACNVGWFSVVTTPTLISKASGEALSVALEAGIVNDVTASFILSNARSRALSLAGQLDSSALDEELLTVLGAASSTQSNETASSEAAQEEVVETASEEESEEEEDAGFEGLGDLFG